MVCPRRLRATRSSGIVAHVSASSCDAVDECLARDDANAAHRAAPPCELDSPFRSAPSFCRRPSKDEPACAFPMASGEYVRAASASAVTHACPGCNVAGHLQGRVDLQQVIFERRQLAFGLALLVDELGRAMLLNSNALGIDQPD